MRIALVSHVARPSGGEIVVERLAGALTAEHEVLALFFEDGPMVGRLTVAGARAEVVPMGTALVDHRRAAARVPVVSVVRSVRAMVTALRRTTPDVVYAHSLKAGLIAGVAARLLRIPFVWHVHDRISTDYLPPAQVALLRLALRTLPDAVAVNSDAVLATFRSRGPRAVVPNPVPRPPAPRPLRAPDVPPVVFGIVGRITRWKGQDVFLRAFAAAFPDGPQRAVVVGDALFGEDDDMRALLALIDDLGLGERVELRGFREDVWGELERLDVLVHASRIPEPFGLVVVEGVLAGRPVIATQGGGPSEYLVGVHGTTLVPPDDVDALAAALRDAATLGVPDAAGLAARFDPAQSARVALELLRRAADN